MLRHKIAKLEDIKHIYFSFYRRVHHRDSSTDSTLWILLQGVGGGQYKNIQKLSQAYMWDSNSNSNYQWLEETLLLCVGVQFDFETIVINSEFYLLFIFTENIFL